MDYHSLNLQIVRNISNSHCYSSSLSLSISWSLSGHHHGNRFFFSLFTYTHYLQLCHFMIYAKKDLTQVQSTSCIFRGKRTGSCHKPDRLNSSSSMLLWGGPIVGLGQTQRAPSLVSRYSLQHAITNRLKGTAPLTGLAVSSVYRVPKVIPSS